MKPTSLNGGEGLAAGSTGDIGGSKSEGEGEKVVERSPKSTGDSRDVVRWYACRCLFLGSMTSNITNMSRTNHEHVTNSTN
jgi:hypothetical protein